MGRGIVESGLFRSERYGLEVRTTDPATYSEGEAWIRSDVAPDTDQIATLRFANGGGTIDIPIYAAGTAGQNVSEAVAVQVGGQQGYIPIASDGATYSQLRAQHAGSQYQFHDAKSASAIPASGVSRWTFDNDDTNSGTAIDVWASNNGTINGATTGVSGANQTYNTDEAYSFDGSDDDVNVPDDSTLDLSSEISIALWAKFDTLGDAGLVTKAGATEAYLFDVGSSNIRWFAREPSSNVLYDLKYALSNLSSGTWYHLTGTYNGSTAELYVDGASVNSASASGNIGINSADVEIGNAPFGRLDGDLDDIRLYSKGLSGTEVNDLYNTGSI